MSEIVIHETLEDIYAYENDPDLDPLLYPNIDATYAALAEMQAFYGFSIDYDNAELVYDPNNPNAQVMQTSRAYLRTDTSDVVNGFEMPFVSELQDTQDITAKGFEFELTYNPKPNWRIMMNVAEIESITTNSAPRLGEWLEILGPIVNNPNGIGALSRGNPAGELEEGEETMGQWWLTDIVNPSNAIMAYDGLPSPELRRWRVNFTTNYNFRSGRFKGWGVGGSVRWQDKVTIGNALITAEDGSLVPDVNQPYWGPDQTSVDLFFSYSRKIFNNKVNWRLQFNIRNVFFDKHDLIPIVAQPDGSIAEVRVAPPRVFTLTSTLRW
jgi:outer membrane receptor protein involved in Fe transport